MSSEPEVLGRRAGSSSDRFDRQRPVRFQVSQPWLEELLFEADGLLSVGAGGVANYVPWNYLRRGR